jgi:hypothetical protein
LQRVLTDTGGRNIAVSPFSVRSVWLRHDLRTMKHRLAYGLFRAMRARHGHRDTDPVWRQNAVITRSRRNEAPFARATRRLRSNHIERRATRQRRQIRPSRLRASLVGSKVRCAKTTPGSSCRTAAALPLRFLPLDGRHNAGSGHWVRQWVRFAKMRRT